MIFVLHGLGKPSPSKPDVAVGHAVIEGEDIFRAFVDAGWEDNISTVIALIFDFGDSGTLGFIVAGIFAANWILEVAAVSRATHVAPSGVIH